MERTDDDLLDIAELAKHLGIQRRSVNRMIAEGRLPPPVRYGGLVRWRWGLIRDWHRAWETLARMQKVGQSGTPPAEDGTFEDTDDLPPSRPKKPR